MKAKILSSFLIVAFLISLSLVSSAVIINQSSLTFNSNHNSQNTFSFILNNTNLVQNITNITLSVTDLSSGSYSIKAGNITLPSPIWDIPNGSSSQLYIATVNVPLYQPSATYIGSLILTAKNSDGTPVSDSKTITLYVNSTPSFTNSYAVISKTSNGTVTVINNGNTLLSEVDLSSIDALNVNFSSNKLYNIASGQSQTVTVYPLDNLNKAGSKSVTILLASPNLANQTITYNVFGSYCKAGPVGGNLSISEIDDKSDLPDSRDSWDWRPLDNLDIRVKISNIDKESGGKDRSVTVRLGLFKQGSTSEFDLGTDAIEQTVDISRDQTDKAVDFQFQLPADIDEASYTLYAKVYDGETKQCAEINTDASTPVSVTKESDYIVAIGNLSDLETAICGGTFDITPRVYNIGSDDATGAYVRLVNTELGLNMISDKFNLNGDSSDYKEVPFSFTIPRNVTSKRYTLYFYTYYGQDKKGSKDPFTTFIDVSGCSQASTSITAALSSETPRAIIGNQVIVETTIKNSGSGQGNYTVDVADNTAWSNLAQIDPASFTLAAGESKKVNIYLDVKSDATASDQSFTIRVMQNGAVTEQKVQLTLEKGFSASGLVNYFKTNWFIYLVILINVILIIAIILVVKSIVNRRD